MIFNNCLFIKLGVRIKTFPANSHSTVIFEALPCAGYTQLRLAQFCSTSNSYKTFTFQYTVSSCERLSLVVLCHHTGLNVIDESAILLLIEWGFQDWKHPSECWNLDHSHEKWQKMLAILFQEKTKKMLVFPKNAEKNANIIEKGLPFIPQNISHSSPQFLPYFIFIFACPLFEESALLR